MIALRAVDTTGQLLRSPEPYDVGHAQTGLMPGQARVVRDREDVPHYLWYAPSNLWPHPMALARMARRGIDQPISFEAATVLRLTSRLLVLHALGVRTAERIAVLSGTTAYTRPSDPIDWAALDEITPIDSRGGIAMHRPGIVACWPIIALVVAGNDTTFEHVLRGNQLPVFIGATTENNQQRVPTIPWAAMGYPRYDGQENRPRTTYNIGRQGRQDAD